MSEQVVDLEARLEAIRAAAYEAHTTGGTLWVETRCYGNPHTYIKPWKCVVKCQDRDLYAADGKTLIEAIRVLEERVLVGIETIRADFNTRMDSASRRIVSTT